MGTTSGQSASAFSNFSVLASQDTTYDGLDRVVQQTLLTAGAAQTLAQASYDAANRLQCAAVRMNAATFSSEPSSACTQGTAGSYGPDQITYLTYDSANEALTQVSGYGTSSQRTDVTNTYLPDGEIGTQADGKGNLTTYGYDGYNRRIQIFYPNPANGGTSSTTDYEQYAYDNNGNITADRRRDGNTISYRYDAVNNPLNSANGASLGYDVMNRLTSSTLNGQTVSFGYDGLGPQNTQLPGVTVVANKMSEEDQERAAEQDEAICRKLKTARCWASANERRGARAAGRPLPPLVTWRDGGTTSPSMVNGNRVTGGAVVILGGGALVCVLAEPCGGAAAAALGLGALIGAGAQ